MYIHAKQFVYIVLLCFGICVLIAFAGHVLETANHVLERAEKQKAVETLVRFRLLLFFLSSFSQVQRETHMSEQILVGGNEAVCMARCR